MSDSTFASNDSRTSPEFWKIPFSRRCEEAFSLKSSYPSNVRTHTIFTVGIAPILLFIDVGFHAEMITSEQSIHLSQFNFFNFATIWTTIYSSCSPRRPTYVTYGGSEHWFALKKNVHKYRSIFHMRLQVFTFALVVWCRNIILRSTDRFFSSFRCRIALGRYINQFVVHHLEKFYTCKFSRNLLDGIQIDGFFFRWLVHWYCGGLAQLLSVPTSLSPFSSSSSPSKSYRNQRTYFNYVAHKIRNATQNNLCRRR